MSEGRGKEGQKWEFFSFVLIQEITIIVIIIKSNFLFYTYSLSVMACVAELAATICRGRGQVQICSENTKVKRIRSQDQDKA